MLFHGQMESAVISNQKATRVNQSVKSVNFGKQFGRLGKGWWITIFIVPFGIFEKN